MNGDALHRAFPSISIEALEAEVRRELEQRRRFYPGRVAKGNMTTQQADREIALAAAWAEDIARIRAAWFTPADRRPAGNPGPTAPRHGFSFGDRRRGLLRELDLRDRVWPQWIANGRITSEQAAHRIACLACLLEIYEDGWDWIASNGRRGNSAAAVTDRDEAAALAEFTALQAERAARQGQAQRSML